MLDVIQCDGFGFNPTLVRLRFFEQEVDMQVGIQFQSHAGSIEVHPVLGQAVGEIWFQSHAGSIEVMTSAKRSRASSRFQSHAGSIEVRLMGFMFMVLCIVSIPRWFD